MLLFCLNGGSQAGALSHVGGRPSLRTGLCAARRSRRSELVIVRNRPQEKLSDDFSLEKLGYIEVGVLLGPHGYKGAAKVRSLSDFPKQRLAEENSLRYLKSPNRLYPRPIKILRGQKAAQKETWIVWLEGLTSPEEVKTLKGARICVKLGDKPKVKRGEYYVRDLVGLKVRLYGKGALLGAVNDVYTHEELTKHIRNPSKVGHDMLEIMIDDNAEDLVLVPFVKQLVPVVDIEGGEILIDPPEGLLDVAKVNLIVRRGAPRLFLRAAEGTMLESEESQNES
uniref:RimM N-terminal domain-containing protein n=1 Tax=Rhodosorus marinus TaxID=101924 RepID=A0A7S0G5Z6_9RHOD|mmetsp:Transcript_24740/g.35635  ORF Transcript_24740/g.35635 Transcript_24740/m.35635 type:complete len:282 (+) Transcript_24740:91-936(+)